MTKAKIALYVIGVVIFIGLAFAMMVFFPH